jgi:hypothetical protein
MDLAEAGHGGHQKIALPTATNYLHPSCHKADEACSLGRGTIYLPRHPAGCGATSVLLEIEWNRERVEKASLA